MASASGADVAGPSGCSSTKSFAKTPRSSGEQKNVLSSRARALDFGCGPKPSQRLNCETLNAQASASTGAQLSLSTATASIFKYCSKPSWDDAIVSKNYRLDKAPTGRWWLQRTKNAKVPVNASQMNPNHYYVGMDEFSHEQYQEWETLRKSWKGSQNQIKICIQELGSMGSRLSPKTRPMFQAKREHLKQLEADIEGIQRKLFVMVKQAKGNPQAAAEQIRKSEGPMARPQFVEKADASKPASILKKQPMVVERQVQQNIVDNTNAEYLEREVYLDSDDESVNLAEEDAHQRNYEQLVNYERRVVKQPSYDHIEQPVVRREHIPVAGGNPPARVVFDPLQEDFGVFLGLIIFIFFQLVSYLGLGVMPFVGLISLIFQMVLQASIYIYQIVWARYQPIERIRFQDYFVKFFIQLILMLAMSVMFASAVQFQCLKVEFQGQEMTTCYGGHGKGPLGYIPDAAWYEEYHAETDLDLRQLENSLSRLNSSLGIARHSFKINQTVSLEEVEINRYFERALLNLRLMHKLNIEQNIHERPLMMWPAAAAQTITFRKDLSFWTQNDFTLDEICVSREKLDVFVFTFTNKLSANNTNANLTMFFEDLGHEVAEIDLLQFQYFEDVENDNRLFERLIRSANNGLVVFKNYQSYDKRVKDLLIKVLRTIPNTKTVWNFPIYYEKPISLDSREVQNATGKWTEAGFNCHNLIITEVSSFDILPDNCDTNKIKIFYEAMDSLKKEFFFPIKDKIVNFQPPTIDYNSFWTSVCNYSKQCFEFLVFNQFQCMLFGLVIASCLTLVLDGYSPLIPLFFFLCGGINYAIKDEAIEDLFGIEIFPISLNICITLQIVLFLYATCMEFTYFERIKASMEDLCSSVTWNAKMFSMFCSAILGFFVYFLFIALDFFYVFFNQYVHTFNHTNIIIIFFISLKLLLLAYCIKPDFEKFLIILFCLAASALALYICADGLIMILTIASFIVIYAIYMVFFKIYSFLLDGLLLPFLKDFLNAPSQVKQRFVLLKYIAYSYKISFLLILSLGSVLQFGFPVAHVIIRKATTESLTSMAIVLAICLVAVLCLLYKISFFEDSIMLKRLRLYDVYFQSAGLTANEIKQCYMKSAEAYLSYLKEFHVEDARANTRANLEKFKASFNLLIQRFNADKSFSDKQQEIIIKELHTINEFVLKELDKVTEDNYPNRQNDINRLRGQLVPDIPRVQDPLLPDRVEYVKDRIRPKVLEDFMKDYPQSQCYVIPRVQAETPAHACKIVLEDMRAGKTQVPVNLCTNHVSPVVALDLMGPNTIFAHEIPNGEVKIQRSFFDKFGIYFLMFLKWFSSNIFMQCTVAPTAAKLYDELLSDLSTRHLITRREEFERLVLENQCTQELATHFSWVNQLLNIDNEVKKAMNVNLSSLIIQLIKRNNKIIEQEHRDNYKKHPHYNRVSMKDFFFSIENPNWVIPEDPIEGVVFEYRDQPYFTINDSCINQMIREVEPREYCVAVVNMDKPYAWAHKPEKCFQMGCLKPELETIGVRWTRNKIDTDVVIYNRRCKVINKSKQDYNAAAIFLIKTKNNAIVGNAFLVFREAKIQLCTALHVVASRCDEQCYGPPHFSTHPNGSERPSKLSRAYSLSDQVFKKNNNHDVSFWVPESFAVSNLFFKNVVVNSPTLVGELVYYNINRDQIPAFSIASGGIMENSVLWYINPHNVYGYPQQTEIMGHGDRFWYNSTAGYSGAPIIHNNSVVGVHLAGVPDGSSGAIGVFDGYDVCKIVNPLLVGEKLVNQQSDPESELDYFDKSSRQDKTLQLSEVKGEKSSFWYRDDTGNHKLFKFNSDNLDEVNSFFKLVRKLRGGNIVISHKGAVASFNFDDDNNINLSECRKKLEALQDEGYVSQSLIDSRKFEEEGSSTQVVKGVYEDLERRVGTERLRFFQNLSLDELMAYEEDRKQQVADVLNEIRRLEQMVKVEESSDRHVEALNEYEELLRDYLTYSKDYDELMADYLAKKEKWKIVQKGLLEEREKVQKEKKAKQKEVASKYSVILQNIDQEIELIKKRISNYKANLDGVAFAEREQECLKTMEELTAKKKDIEAKIANEKAILAKIKRGEFGEGYQEVKESKEKLTSLRKEMMDIQKQRKEESKLIGSKFDEQDKELIRQINESKPIPPRCLKKPTKPTNEILADLAETLIECRKGKKFLNNEIYVCQQLIKSKRELEDTTELEPHANLYEAKKIQVVREEDVGHAEFQLKQLISNMHWYSQTCEQGHFDKEDFDRAFGWLLDDEFNKDEVKRLALFYMVLLGEFFKHFIEKDVNSLTQQGFISVWAFLLHIGNYMDIPFEYFERCTWEWITQVHMRSIDDSELAEDIITSLKVDIWEKFWADVHSLFKFVYLPGESVENQNQDMEVKRIYYNMVPSNTQSDCYAQNTASYYQPAVVVCKNCKLVFECEGNHLKEKTGTLGDLICTMECARRVARNYQLHRESCTMVQPVTPIVRFGVNDQGIGYKCNHGVRGVHSKQRCMLHANLSYSCISERCKSGFINIQMSGRSLYADPKCIVAFVLQDVLGHSVEECEPGIIDGLDMSLVKNLVDTCVHGEKKNMNSYRIGPEHYIDCDSFKILGERVDFMFKKKIEEGGLIFSLSKVEPQTFEILEPQINLESLEKIVSQEVKRQVSPMLEQILAEIQGLKKVEKKPKGAKKEQKKDWPQNQGVFGLFNQEPCSSSQENPTNPLSPIKEEEIACECGNKSEDINIINNPELEGVDINEAQDPSKNAECPKNLNCPS